MATTAAVYDRVYLWERPVRLYHWATTCSVTTLVATGLVIGNPPAFLTPVDASGSHWFGLVRTVHFVAGFVFMFAFVVRVYWLFAGNRFARWNVFFPLTPGRLTRQLRSAVDVLFVDILQVRARTSDVRGHNALAATTYAVLFLVSAFAIVTGLALYAPMSGWWLPQLFTWVTPLMGSEAEVRMWHHLGTWFFIVFTIVHVYLSIFHDVRERGGEISSIVSGTKYFRREQP